MLDSFGKMDEVVVVDVEEGGNGFDREGLAAAGGGGRVVEGGTVALRGRSSFFDLPKNPPDSFSDFLRVLLLPFFPEDDVDSSSPSFFPFPVKFPNNKVKELFLRLSSPAP